MTMPATTEVEDRTGYELFDADGHVIEDVQGIIAKMPSNWGDAMRGRFTNPLGKLHGMTILPWLGFLSTIPTGGGGGGAARAKGPNEHGENPESWEHFLETVGIERTVLYPTLGLTIGRVREMEYVEVVTRAWNDWMAETYLQHPSGRFQAAALIPMQKPAAAVAELKRVVNDLGFCAAVLPANGLTNHLGSPMYFPVYEAAQELDVGLACHGGVHDGFGFDDFNVFAPVHALGFPFGLLRALGGMLFNNVFETFSGLRVAFLEGGAAWLLMAAERFSESYGGIRPMTTENVLQLPDGMRVKDYMTRLMQEGRMVTGIEGGEDQLARAIEYFDSTSFMYSSDFPHEVNIESCKHELEELSELPISDEAKRMLRGGTAREFYKL